MKEMETCGICRESHPRDQLIEFDGELYCRDCLERGAVIYIRLFFDTDVGSKVCL